MYHSIYSYSRKPGVKSVKVKHNASGITVFRFLHGKTATLRLLVNAAKFILPYYITIVSQKKLHFLHNILCSYYKAR